MMAASQREVSRPRAANPWSKRVSHWGPVVLAAAGIFTLSSLPGGPDLALFKHADKLAHVAVYGLLGLLLVRALAGAIRRSPATISLLTIALITAYGISDELHQSFVPNRSVEVLDVVADAVGAALACLVWFQLVRRFLRRGVE